MTLSQLSASPATSSIPLRPNDDSGSTGDSSDSSNDEDETNPRGTDSDGTNNEGTDNEGSDNEGTDDEDGIKDRTHRDDSAEDGVGDNLEISKEGAQKDSDSYQDSSRSGHSSFIDDEDASELPCLPSEIHEAFERLKEAGFDVPEQTDGASNFRREMKKAIEEIKNDQVDLSDAIARLEAKHDKFYVKQDEIWRMVQDLYYTFAEIARTNDDKGKIASSLPPSSPERLRYPSDDAPELEISGEGNTTAINNA